MINQKFEALTVIKQSGLVKHGRNNVKIWLCQCDCGETLEVDQNSLVKGIVPACKICRRGKCVICGGKITDPSFSVKRNTCSEMCRKEQQRRRHRKRYAKLTANDPNYNKIRYRLRLDNIPDYNKVRYLSFKKRLLHMNEEQASALISKMTRQSNEWRKKWRIQTKQLNPEEYERFLARARRRYRKHEAKKRLTMLMTTQIKGKNNE